MNWLIFIVYILGFAYSTKRVTSAMAWSIGGEPGVGDYVFSLIAALSVAIFWPLWVPFYIAIRLIGGTKDLNAGFSKLFPKPMSREERQVAKMKAQQREIRQHRRDVNQKERELGMTLTTWDS